MKTEIFDMIGIPVDYVVIGVVVLFLIVFIMLISTMAKLSKMKKSYNTFMSGKDAKSLEEVINERLGSIEGHDEAIKDIYAKFNYMKSDIQISYQKLGFVKYDAFKETGGKMSFILVLLNKDNNGIMLNCMHSNADGCYTYAKRIENGTSKISLSNEETVALKQALGETA